MLYYPYNRYHHKWSYEELKSDYLFDWRAVFHTPHLAARFFIRSNKTVFMLTDIPMLISC